MFMHIRNTLRSIKIIPKYAMYQVSVHWLFSDSDPTWSGSLKLIWKKHFTYSIYSKYIQISPLLSVGF